MLKLLLTILTLVSIHNQAYGQGFIDPHTAADMVARSEAILIDVREAEEISAGMAEPAIWFPTSKIEQAGSELQDFLDRLDASKTIIVYCRTGRRAASFVDILRARGFKAENMGAFNTWVEAGLPVAIPSSSAPYD